MSRAHPSRVDPAAGGRRLGLLLVFAVLALAGGGARAGDLLDEPVGGRPVREWVRLLKSGAPGERREAIEAVSELGAEAKQFEGLIRVASNDKSWYVRARAVQALAVIGTPDSAAAIVEALEDPEPEVRSTAAQELRRARVHKSVAVQGLSRLSRDSESSVRSAAAIGLGDYYGEGGAGTLLQLADDGDPSVRYIAMARLAEVAVDSVALAAAERHIGDPDLAVRVVSAGLLWISRGEGEPIALVLMGGLAAPEPRTRRAAMRAISRRPGAAAAFVPLIRTLARTSDDHTRLEAIRALGAIHRDDLSRCAGVLEFDRDSWTVARVAVLDLLRAVDAKCAVPEARIRAHLADAEMAVRLAAVRLLQSRWPQRASDRDVIESGLTSPHHECREAALELVRERTAVEPELTSALRTMLVREPSFRLRRLCSTILNRSSGQASPRDDQGPNGR